MLILSRKKGESIVINNNIEIIITSIEGDQVKLGISAPPNIDIFRREVLDSIQLSNWEAARQSLDVEQFKMLIKQSEKINKKDLKKD
jgi:carbon storage regulator